MFHQKNTQYEKPLCVQGDSGLVLTTDPKPRLRWTSELHNHFIDAVNQLGGPDKATPKTIMRVMGVKGLTLYHLKSHLQKFRLGKQPHNEFNDNSIKEAERDLQRNGASSSGMMSRTMNKDVRITEALQMQMEVQRRLHEQLEVQRHLQMRIEAQGKYMQTILEKACQTLEGENNQGTIDVEIMKGNDPPMNFPSFQDLHIYGKNQFLCSDDLRLKELGTTTACVGDQEDSFKGDHQLQMVPCSINSDTDIDSMDVNETKKFLSLDDGASDKKCGVSTKLKRASPRRVERMTPTMKDGGLTPPRNSSYG
ncbi:Myb family transcription factor APL [Acorus calamus]|uniref:Myb family transcription factor APL n=1 Tax=Acorus calamus TaxID=4465 RepID=A0AAV9BZS5_ACOCL|nr:Myb family transcription factor APL [Acorus calamus]